MNIYCCGRADCPDVHCPGRTAKVGKRYPAAEPLPPSAWRLVLSRVSEVVLLIIVALFVSAVVVGIAA